MKKNYFKSMRLKFAGNVLIAGVFLILAQSCGGSKGSDPTPTPPVTPPIVTPPTTAETPTTANFDKLTVFNSFKASQANPYTIALIGDSYTQGNFYSFRLRGKLLLDGYLDGGPGYCSFGRWDPNELYSIDGSMDPAELTFTYSPVQWTSQDLNTLGPCDYVTSNVANAAINVTSAVALNTMTILYEKHTAAGDFRYRVNGGAWTTVSMANPTQDIGTVAVDVSAAGSNIKLDIEALSAGEVFSGVIGKRSGNVLTFHKVGSAGATASQFATHPLWKTSMAALAPKGVIIMFGVNEQIQNITPDAMKASVQKIIDNVKAISPTCDIMIMCPPETMYENEDPRTYKVAAYGDMLYALAVANNAAFINLPKVFGHFSQALVDNGTMDVDRRHPGDKGSELIATTIYAAFKK